MSDREHVIWTPAVAAAGPRRASRTRNCDYRDRSQFLPFVSSSYYPTTVLPYCMLSTICGLQRQLIASCNHGSVFCVYLAGVCLRVVLNEDVCTAAASSRCISRCATKVSA